MAKSESTGKSIAASAAKILHSKSASVREKSVAASALSQMQGKNSASKSVASAAAQILKDPKASRDAKSTAASALTQSPRFDTKKVKSSDVYRAVESYAAKKKG